MCGGGILGKGALPQNRAPSPPTPFILLFSFFFPRFYVVQAALEVLQVLGLQVLATMPQLMAT